MQNHRMHGDLLNTAKLQAEWGLRKEVIVAEKGLGVAYHRPPDDPLQRAMAVLTARNQIVGKSVRAVAFHSIYLGASMRNYYAHMAALGLNYKF